MMADYLKRTLRLTAMIFTVIVLLQMVTLHDLDNKMLYELLALSFTASLVKFVFFRDVLFQFAIGQQIAYLITVWVLVIASNWLFQWQMSVASIFSSLLMVVAGYFCVRLTSYQLDKADVKKMNELLDNHRKNKSQ